jgi:hypothetical protein
MSLKLKNKTMNKMISINGCDYELNQVDATDGLDVVNKIKTMQASRYFDKYVCRTKDGVAMACYADDTNNCWKI